MVRPLKKPTNPVVVGTGIHGFRHQQDYDWYVRHFHTRPVSVERPIDVPAAYEHPFYIRVIRSHRGWIPALSYTTECNSTVVREFCASLMRTDDLQYYAYVRHRVISLSPARLAAFLDIDDPEDFQCPFPPDSVSPTRDEVASILTGTPGAVWTGTAIAKTALTDDYRILFLVVVGCIFPTSFKASADWETARIMYAVGTGMRVSLPRLLFDFIVGPTRHTHARTALHCGGLITRLCMSAGVESRATDTRQAPLGPIGEVTRLRSSGQIAGVRKRTRAEDDDDEDDDDAEIERLFEEHTAGPSEPSSSAARGRGTGRGGRRAGRAPDTLPLDRMDAIIRQQARILDQQDDILARLDMIEREMIQQQRMIIERFDDIDDRLDGFETRTPIHPASPASPSTSAHPDS